MRRFDRRQSAPNPLSAALSRSPSLAAFLIILSTVAAVVFGAILTPPTNVSAVPFVLPTLIAVFQGVAWVWATSFSMMILYILIAFGVESVTLSVGLVNVLGLLLFGIVFTWVSAQRTRSDDQLAALELMQQNLELAMRNSGLRLFAHDRELRYTWIPFVHPAYQEAQMLGHTDEAIFPRDEARELMRLKRRALETGTEEHSEVTVTIDGEQRIFDMIIVPTFDRSSESGRVDGLTCVSIDITEFRNAVEERKRYGRQQQKALADLARANRNLERFTSMVAHDLSQPLTVIQGYSELLRRRIGPDATEPQQSALDALDRSVRQMKALVDDLRDVAAMAQGQFSLQPQSVDLAETIQAVVADAQEMTTAHTITFQGNENLITQCDPVRVHQLVANLLTNAIKYSPEGGEIEVMLSSRENWCVLEITDQGPGISRDEIDTLFEMFSRLERSRTTEGLGLGLYICKGIVDAHRGSIQVRSTLGEGSTFIVMLPLESEPAPADASDPDPIEEVRITP